MKKLPVPKSARNNWQLWKLCQDLTLEEISVLVTKRKQDLKHTKNPDEIKKLRTDIAILIEAYDIIKKRRS